MTLRVDCFSLVAQLMPQRFTIFRCEVADYLVVKDLDNDFEIMLPYYGLTTAEDAARLISDRVTTYQTLLASWHGNHTLVWC